MITTLEIVSIAHKNESIRQLQIHRQVLLQTKAFAESKLKTLDEGHPQRSEFHNQLATCLSEISKIDNCIKWIEGL